MYSIEFLSPWHRLLTEVTADNFGLALRQVFFNQTYPATSKPSLPQSLLSSWSPSPSPWNQCITVIHDDADDYFPGLPYVCPGVWQSTGSRGKYPLLIIIIIISVVQVSIIVLIFSSLSIKNHHHLYSHYPSHHDHDQVRIVAAGVTWDDHGNSFFTKLLPIISNHCP